MIKTITKLEIKENLKKDIPKKKKIQLTPYLMISTKDLEKGKDVVSHHCYSTSYRKS